MYPNLRAEMARLNIGIRDIAEKIDKSEAWVQNRLSGKCRFPNADALRVRKEFFASISFEYLFCDTAIIPCEVATND